MLSASSVCAAPSGNFSIARRILNINSIDELAEFVRFPSDCLFIDLSIHEGFTVKNVQTFILALSSLNKPILSFDLSNSLIGDGAMEVILNTLVNNPYQNRLETLNLSNTGLTNQCSDSICGFLDRLFKNRDPLNCNPFSLDLSHNTFRNEPAANLIKKAVSVCVYDLSLASNLISDSCCNLVNCWEISGNLDLRGNVLSKKTIDDLRWELRKTVTRLIA